MAKSSLKFRLRLGMIVLLALLVVLTATGIYTIRYFRSLVFDISRRSQELPAAVRLGSSISELQRIVSEIKGTRIAEQRVQNRLEGRIQKMEFFGFSKRPDLKSYSFFLKKMDDYSSALDAYETLVLARPDSDESKAKKESVGEQETILKIRGKLKEIRPEIEEIRWTTDNEKIDWIDGQLAEIQKMTESLPNGLHQELAGFSDQVRSQYRFIRWTIIGVGVASIILLFMLIHLAILWVFFPLKQLVIGSRRVAGGDFGYRIQLATNDEFNELAKALNQMTERFEGVRDDLDEQVKERSEEVIRNERLASVGYLAAGVAHEINNPLASIAMSAESLQRRIFGLLDPKKTPEQVAGEYAVVEKYVAMIQNEAFRCKGITEKLLDFSRSGRGEKSRTELTQIASGMAEMALTQTRYRNKKIQIVESGPVYAMVNEQEMKQVILNLLTNALDSIEPDGVVTIAAEQQKDKAVLTVSDNGGGMESETIAHIFEPFFTKKDPGVGTGLGLAIASRIISGHKGKITASSPGLGQGAVFRIELPT